MNKRTAALIFFTGLMFAGCAGNSSNSKKDTSYLKLFGTNSNSNVLVGAGVVFTFPLLSKLFAEYNQQAHVMVDYQAIGRGPAILQLTDKRVDFIFTDAALTDGQTKKMAAPVLNVPLCGISQTAGTAKKGFILAVLYKEQNYDGRNLPRAQKLLKLLWWNIHTGQKYCSDFSYAPLAPPAVADAEKMLKSATFSGKPILQ